MQDGPRSVTTAGVASAALAVGSAPVAASARTPPGADSQRLVLTCRNLVKQYPGVTALDHLDFTGHGGTVHAILGENGAGKSTFVKALGGALRLDEGTVELDGERLPMASPRSHASAGISVAYQDPSLPPDLTVAEAIWLGLARPGRLRTVSRGALHRRTLALVERLAAPALDPDARIRSLSTAQQAVAELLRALASEPRVLIMDEATATLPPSEAQWALGLARELAGRGCIVIFISHRIAEIRQVADVVSVLRNGARVLERRAAEVTDDEMIEAMLGRKPATLYPSATTPPRETVAMSVRELSVPNRVHGVSFDVREGEIVGLAGLEGHGQAEVLLALFGLAQSRGEIAVGGEPVSVRSPHGAIGDGFALIPEDRRHHGLLLTKTIRENVTLATLPQVSRLGFVSRKREAAATAEAIHDLEIKCRSSEDPVTSLSGGNQQKVLIAKLLRLQARVLLLHDLTRGVDVGTKAEIFALIRDVAAAGRGVLFYSTDAQELVHMCDRIIVMRRGRIAASLSGGAQTEAGIMQAAFGEGADPDAGAGDD